MVLLLLLLVCTNFSNVLANRYELKKAVGSIIIGCFVLLAFIYSIIAQEISLRGSVIKKSDNPRLYLIFLIIMFCIASAFCAIGFLWMPFK